MEQAIAEITWRCRCCGEASPMSEACCRRCGARWAGSNASRLSALVSNDSCESVQNNVVNIGEVNIGGFFADAMDDVRADDEARVLAAAPPQESLLRRMFYATVIVAGWLGAATFVAFLVFMAVIIAKVIFK